MLRAYYGILLLALAGASSEDRELARRLSRGDPAALRALFDRYHAPLFAFIRSRGFDVAETQDIVQHAFVKLWEARDRLRVDMSARAYLYRIALNRALNESRRSGRTTSELSDRPTDEPSPISRTADIEFRTAVDAAVSRLPERRRMVFEMCMLQHLTYAETAAALNVTVKTVENHMSLALKDLRIALSDFRAFDPDDA